MTKALLIVDVQNDFCPGGSLAVPEGDRVVAVINRLIREGNYDVVAASLDWHPANHSSFVSQGPQGIWPDHCVQGGKGADFHPALNTARIGLIQKKGCNVAVDSYSAFQDNDKVTRTGLDEKLKALGVTELHVCGLATEYCVKYTALDARAMLPEVKVLFVNDASRGLNPEDCAQAVREMQAAGIRAVPSALLLPPRAATRRLAP